MRISQTESRCSRCLEAFVVADRVYCGADGTFRSLQGNTSKCKAFSPKFEYAAITTDLVEMEAGCERLNVCERFGNG